MPGLATPVCRSERRNPLALSFFLCSYSQMERFDPSIAGQTPAFSGPDWTPSERPKRDLGFGERAIGELIQAIVARLGQDNPCMTVDD